MQETATPQECVLPKPRLLSDIETMLAAREHESIEDIVAEMAAIDKLKNQVKQMRPTSTKIIQTYRKKIKKIQQTAETTRAAGRQKAHKGDYEAGKKASSAAAEMLREATGLEHDIVKLQVDIRIKEDDAIELNRNLQSVLVLNIRREEEMVRLAAKVHEYVELEEYGSAKALDLLMKEYGTVGEQITNLAVWKKKKSDEYDKKMAIEKKIELERLAKKKEADDKEMAIQKKIELRRLAKKKEADDKEMAIQKKQQQKEDALLKQQEEEAAAVAADLALKKKKADEDQAWLISWWPYVVGLMIVAGIVMLVKSCKEKAAKEKEKLAKEKEQEKEQAAWEREKPEREKKQKHAAKMEKQEQVST